MCARACVRACTCNVYVQHKKVIPVSRVDGTEVPSKMIVVLLVSDVFCLVLRCHAEGSYLVTDHLFGLLKQCLEGC